METRGRKTKLTDDMIEAIYTALKNRMSWNQIAALVGVDPKTLRNWRFHTRRMRPRQPSQAYLNTPLARFPNLTYSQNRI